MRRSDRGVLTRCDLCVFTNKDSDLDGVRARGEFWASAVRCEFVQCVSLLRGVLSVGV